MTINFENIILAYEREVVAWVRNNYLSLGFDEIIEENDKKTPDFVMLRGGKKVKVEIEIFAKSFIRHT